TARAAEAAGELGHLDERLRAPRVEIGDLGHPEQVTARRPEEAGIRLGRPRIGGEVLRGAELCRVHEDGGDDPGGVAGGTGDVEEGTGPPVKGAPPRDGRD